MAVAQSMGLLVGSIIFDVRKASSATSIIILSSMLLGGFYSQHLPEGMLDISYASFIR